MSKSTIFVLACFFLVTVITQVPPKLQRSLNPQSVCTAANYTRACKVFNPSRYCEKLMCQDNEGNLIVLNPTPSGMWCAESKKCEDKKCVNDTAEIKNSFSADDLNYCWSGLLVINGGFEAFEVFRSYLERFVGTLQNVSLAKKH